MAVLFGALAACHGNTRAPQRCRNLITNSGWRLPPFAKPEAGAAWMIGEGPADGAIAQMIERPAELSGVGVIAVGYARVETPQAMAPTDDDVTAQLWGGTVNLVNASSRNLRDFPGPYARLRFTGREVASGRWKRLVTPAIPAGRARVLYPHFAFWGARLAPGVKLHLAAVSLAEAPAESSDDPESWVVCPELPAPVPALESATIRQWNEGRAPNGAFDDSFNVVSGRELRLSASYRQGSLVADRFLISLTEDGSDPRLSPTSRITTVLAERGVERWEAAVRVKPQSRHAIAVAAAVLTKDGLRAQTPLLPPAWQK